MVKVVSSVFQKSKIICNRLAIIAHLDATFYILQRWPKETLRVLFYEAKVPNSDCIAKYKNAAMPLKTIGINTTQQNFQMRSTTLFYIKGLKSYQPSDSEFVVFIVK